ncbi:MAG: prepilin-type N-terminal cleavage/methylation domain-containing protein [Planctomycetes bacterium]|nr:prepilin-type N-terminal cleavage/methylation domain-containing protein [Planctomycetota bacterium]
MASARRTKGAFTLIELLVVVAIIALLISILLPALSRAKEQAKTTVCLSNLRSIGQSANTYLLENSDMPWALHGEYEAAGWEKNRSWTWYTEFIWGGGRPDRTQDQFEAAVGGGGKGGGYRSYDMCIVPPRVRPMNKYIGSSVSWDNPERDRNPKRVAIPADIPDFFKCPSDCTPWVPTVGQANEELEDASPFSTWEFWGTSYAINWYWPYYYEPLPWVRDLYSGDTFLAILGAITNEAGLGTRMLRNKGGRWASEFILFYENRLNYAMEGARPEGMTNANEKNVVGWHKQKDYHAAGFMDGSGRYTKYDTRYVNGPGWTTWPSPPWEGQWEPYDGIDD